MRGLAVAVAVALLGLHVALGLLVDHQAGPLGPDRAAFDVLDPLHTATGIDVVAVLTDLGSFPVALAVAVAGALYAGRQRRLGQAIGLVIGVLLLLIAVNVTKELWGRPRPTRMLTGARGLSFPSGHAAYATTWLAAAMVTGRRGLIAATAVLIAAVMTSRLYLHVHYLTDVVGGAALGGAVFAAVRMRR